MKNNLHWSRWSLGSIARFAAFLACGFGAMLSAQAATVTFPLTNYFQSPFTNTGVRVFPVATPILANGQPIITGLPTPLRMATNGVATTNLLGGNYLLTNTSPAIGILFAVPNSTNTYDVTALAISGYNTFNYTPGVSSVIGTNGIVTTPANGKGDVIIDGAAFAPTFSQITNSLGFLPLTPTQTTNAITNAVYNATNSVASWLTAYQFGSVALSNFATLGTNFFYPRSNPSNFVTATITNGLATINYVNTATNTLYLLLGTAAFSNATAFYLNSNPSNYVTASVTNGLATTLFVQTLSTNATNFAGLLSTNATNFAGLLSTNATNYAGGVATNATNFAKAIGTSITNFIGTTSNALNSAKIDTTGGSFTNSLTGRGNLFVSTNIFATNGLRVTAGITNDNLTANRVVISDANKALTNSTITAAQLLTLPNRVPDLNGMATNLTVFGPFVIGASGTFQISDFDGGKVVVSDTDGLILESAVTTTELLSLTNISGNIQTNLDARIRTVDGIGTNSLTIKGNIIATTNITAQVNLGVGGYITATNLIVSRALVSDANQKITNSVVTSTELAQLSGITGGVQTNIDARIRTVGGSFTNSLLGRGNLSIVSNAFINAAIFTNEVDFLTPLRLTNGFWTNAVFHSPTITNGVNYGNSFSSRGAGTQSQQFGDSASASGDYSVALGSPAQATNIYSTAIGAGAVARAVSSIAVGTGSTSESTGQGGMALGVAAFNSGQFGIALGNSTTCTNDNSVAFGAGARTTEAGQIVMGSTAVSNIVANGTLTVLSGNIVATNYILSANSRLTNAGMMNPIATNLTIYNTNTFYGNNSFPQYEIQTTGSGDQIIDPGTNTLIIITGNATNAFNVAGVKGGRTGRILTIVNLTGQVLTWLHNSGVSGVAAERVLVMGTGADLPTGTNSTSILFYDSTQLRWLVGPTTTTLGVSSLPFNTNQFEGTTVTNIKSGALLTNIVHYGNFTNSGGALYVTGSGSEIISYRKIQFLNRADTTVAADAETTLTNATASGQINIPANYLTQGTTIRVRAGGTTTGGTGGQTEDLKFKANSTTLSTSQVLLDGDSEWRTEFDVTIRTSGAGGTFKSRGTIVDSSNTGVTHPSGSGSIDTTVAISFNFTADRQDGSSISLTCDSLIIEIGRTQ